MGHLQVCQTYRLRELDLRNGDLVIVNKNDIHKTIDTGVPHYERVLIDFEEDFLSIYSKEEMEYLLNCFKINRPVIQLKASEQIIVKNLLNKMQQEQLLKELGYRISLRAKLTELLIFTNRLMQKMNLSINDVDESTAIQKRISKVI
ncbi:MAG: hypothetical protein GX815_05370 [Clostridiales bacterium]|nr:hypothetical protein [Clostridiales bacterium]